GAGPWHRRSLADGAIQRTDQGPLCFTARGRGRITMWYHDRDFFPRSRPRKAKGGIKAQNKRGQFGQSWWAKRWIAVLESFNIGARLGRGRSYARGGQVLSIKVERGEVTASVQGSRPKPYEVSIGINVLSPDDWKKVVQVLAGQALYSARLLAGE